MSIRNRLGTVAALIVMVATTGACSGPDGTGNDGGTSSEGANEAVEEITVFQNANSGTPLGILQREVYAAFEEETGISVRISDVPADNYVQAYEAAVAAGDEADLVITNPTTDKYGWVEQGAVVDMDPYLDRWGLREKLREGALEGWTDAEGQLLGVPYYGFVWPMLWNTEVLESVGVNDIPETKKDLMVAAEKFKESNKSLISIAGGDWPGGGFFLQAIQTRTDAETMTKVFAEGGYCETESVKNSIQDFVEMRDAGVFVASAEGYTMDQQNTLFFNGEAAGLHGATWWFNDVPEGMRENIVVGGIPNPGEGPYSRPLVVSASTSMGFWLSENGEKKAEAVGQLVAMFYEEEYAQKLVSDAAQIPNMTLEEIPVTDNPIYGQVVAPDFEDAFDFILLPDSLIPGDIQPPVDAGAPFQPGRSADEICTGMDSVYR